MPDAPLKRATGAPVAHYIAQATARTWPGTPELTTELIRQSKHVPCWRPVRAGALHAQAASGKAIWMTHDEFRRWRQDCRPVWRRRGWDFSVQLAIGISRRRMANYAGALSPIPKAVSLACAHALIGFPMPIPEGDPEAFADWFVRSFGRARSITTWLEIEQESLNDRVRGFRLVGDTRVPSAPEIELIRALDWVRRVGPVVVYGDRDPVETFPA